MANKRLPSVPDPVVPLDLIEPPTPDPASTTTATAAAEIERNGDGTVTPSGARELVRARWATEAATREDLQRLFDTIDMEEGLSLLARMREMCELAARSIERRRTEETDKTACYICGVTKKKLGARNWRMVTTKQDPKTGTMFTIYLCSDACYIGWNKQKYGMSAAPDRGMLPGDDPARAKHSIIAHQERVRADGEMQLANERARKGK